MKLHFVYFMECHFLSFNIFWKRQIYQLIFVSINIFCSRQRKVLNCNHSDFINQICVNVTDLLTIFDFCFNILSFFFSKIQYYIIQNSAVMKFTRCRFSLKLFIEILTNILIVLLPIEGFSFFIMNQLTCNY